MRPPRLIRCGDHRLAPYAATCVHVMNRTATEIMPVPNEPGSEVEYDWLCRQCFDEYYLNEDDNVPLDDMRIVCMHCLRQIMRPYGAQMRFRLRQIESSSGGG